MKKRDSKKNKKAAFVGLKQGLIIIGLKMGVSAFGRAPLFYPE